MRVFILVMSFFLLSGCGNFHSWRNDGVRVAILDSGIESRKDFRMDEGWNYLKDSPDTEDEEGHGTRMAELVCQYAPGAVIVPLKISGGEDETKPEYVIQAIYDAVDQYECNVICMSFSIPDSTALREAVEYAWQENVIMISAAGNLGETYKKDKLLYPAAYDMVIGVGAVEENGEVAAYSQRNKSVFVTAPGSSLDGTKQGTSYAAARVAGICASHSWDTPESFQDNLISQAQDRGAPGYDTEYGWGVLSK